jgi:hypothetical protein
MRGADISSLDRGLLSDPIDPIEMLKLVTPLN